MRANFKASLKLLSLIVWFCLWYPPVWIAVRLNKLSWRDAMAQLFNRGMVRIIGIRLKVTGALADARPLLLVANHTSYLDIPLLASCAPLCFTPKSDIAGWPVIGSMSRLAGAIFIDRRTEKMLEMKQALKASLSAGRVVCLFPEATTGNGLHLQPFKSGFFALADEEINGSPLTIQPACITYTQIAGLPITSSQWPSVAWYSDMELAPHAWDMFKLGPISAEISFLPPITIPPSGDRKKIAAQCQQLIAKKLQEMKNPSLDAPMTTRGKLFSHLSRLKR